MKPINFVIVAALWASLLGSDAVTASEPGWSPVVIARGEYRDQIKSMPMEQRPYRPLHFYGNSVRRMHHRGTAAVTPYNVPAPGVFGGYRMNGR